MAVGIGDGGSPVRLQLDGDEPHRLIAGASGSGKSEIVDSMLAHLIHNNRPSDPHFWTIEPKNQVHAFRHVAHVCRFADHRAAEAGLLEEAVRTTESRFRLFGAHPAAPASTAGTRRLPAVRRSAQGWPPPPA